MMSLTLVYYRLVRVWECDVDDGGFHVVESGMVLCNKSRISRACS